MNGTNVSTSKVLTIFLTTIIHNTATFSLTSRRVLYRTLTGKRTGAPSSLMKKQNLLLLRSSLRMVGTNTTDKIVPFYDDKYHEFDGDNDETSSPWSANKLLTKTRFRQHVNPLARNYQTPTAIADSWPCDGTFTDPTLPLHIDIGCAKGGFLLKLASERSSINGSANTPKHNYLGLEIRPSVALFAKQRVLKCGLHGRVDFMGCNANVDLDRILTKYTSAGGTLALASIQFPDPHFKKSHQKRRVVTPALVTTLLKFLPPNGEIFIQSDVQEVLDQMRQALRDEGGKYLDELSDFNEYMAENPIGVMTEREISVLNKSLPVYRTVFRRNHIPIE